MKKNKTSRVESKIKLCVKHYQKTNTPITLDELMSVVPNAKDFPQDFSRVYISIENGDIVVDWTELQKEWSKKNG